jgi:uncharacterized membrane protein
MIMVDFQRNDDGRGRGREEDRKPQVFIAESEQLEAALLMRVGVVLLVAASWKFKSSRATSARSLMRVQPCLIQCT